MRIKIIGENDCARATRHLLRLAGFAVTEFLPADALAGVPLAGYAITIDLAPAPQTPDAHLRPDPPTHQAHSAANEEAARSHRDASSPAFAEAAAGAIGTANGRIHFDSVDSALEAAVLRHVTQLAAAPVILDRPGGVVHSDRELRIVAPNSGDAQADEAAAMAIEFGVLRGLLDLTVSAGARKKWWPFGILAIAGTLGLLRGGIALASERVLQDTVKGHRVKPVLLEPVRLAAAVPQGQFATGQGIKITDGTNFFVVDPCKGQPKFYASINQTANTQLVSGTVSKKIYVCSIHVVTAAAADVAVVEGTGSVCGMGTAGVSGFGGATAATGWNFVANGGIALGNGDSSVGAEGTSGDSLCVFNSGSGQVSGGLSYVVQ